MGRLNYARWRATDPRYLFKLVKAYSNTFVTVGPSNRCIFNGEIISTCTTAQIFGTVFEICHRKWRKIVGFCTFKNLLNACYLRHAKSMCTRLLSWLSSLNILCWFIKLNVRVLCKSVFTNQRTYVLVILSMWDEGCNYLEKNA